MEKKNPSKIIALVDYGMGNILSVKNAFEYAGAEIIVADNPSALEYADKIVLPGVGAFPEGMENLHKRKMVDALNKQVLVLGKKILGICLGMQLMAQKSYEDRECKGLGWIDAEIVRLNPSAKNLRIPHIGWNSIIIKKTNPPSALFENISEPTDFYFVHSYYMKPYPNNQHIISTVFHYGGEFTAAIEQSNIFGVQFHPEKSQDAGQLIIKNFLNL